MYERFKLKFGIWNDLCLTRCWFIHTLAFNWLH